MIPLMPASLDSGSEYGCRQGEDGVEALRT